MSEISDRYARIAGGFGSRVDGGIRPADEAIRGAGGFAPKIEPRPDATEQTRFLCFLGRRV